LTQRCFCRCKTLEGREDGYCSKYSSRFFRLPFDLKNMLFPPKKTKKDQEEQDNSSGGQSIFGSYSMLDADKSKYLKMSLNSIMYIENQINANQNYYHE
jgi:hypothetical protein